MSLHCKSMVSQTWSSTLKTAHQLLTWQSSVWCAELRTGSIHSAVSHVNVWASSHLAAQRVRNKPLSQVRSRFDARDCMCIDVTEIGMSAM